MIENNFEDRKIFFKKGDYSFSREMNHLEDIEARKSSNFNFMYVFFRTLTQPSRLQVFLIQPHDS